MSGRRNGSRRHVGESRRGGSRPSLENLEPRQLLATFTVTNIGDDPLLPLPGTLRYSILAANSTGGANTIRFAITTDSSVQTILPVASLPSIANQLTIDGTTEGSSSTPLIVLDGSLIGGVANGLTVNASKVFINDIAISNFKGNGIQINGSGSSTRLFRDFIGTNSFGNSIAGNGGFGVLVNGASSLLIGNSNPGFGSQGNVISGNVLGGISMTGGTGNQILGNEIGTDSSGNIALGNGGDGISINNGSFAVIGDTDTGGPNVISGNGGNGISLTGGSHNNGISSNYIGTNGSANGFTGGTGGLVALPNTGAGISMNGAPRNAVGDTLPGAGNLISGNGGQGISISNGSTNEMIQGNVIGASLRNAAGIGNKDVGIEISDGSGTTIGGTTAGAANTISFNGAAPNRAAGVVIISGTNIPILSNTIVGNGTLGIDLGDDFITQNNSKGHVGPNNFENFPVLTSVGTAGPLTKIQGTFQSTPSTTFTLQFYANNPPPTANYGQGQLLIGQAQVTTDANGNARISQTLPSPTAIGSYVSATATDSDGNTSEFSKDVKVVADPVTDTAVSISATPTPATLGLPLTYTVTAINNGPNPATNVTLNVNLAATLQNAQAVKSSQGGPFTITGSVLTGDFGTLKSGATATVTITATPSAVGTIKTIASLTSDQIDTVTSNDTATSSLAVDIPADLSVTTQASSLPTNATVGSQFSLVFIAVNNGPGPASGATMTIQLPAGVTFVAAASGGGATPAYNALTNTVTADLGGLSNNGVSAVRLTVAAPAAVPAGGTVSFVAKVSAQQNDSNTANNTATAVVPILAASDLALTVATNPTPALVGDNLTYTYSVTNNGPIADTNVVVTDRVPSASLATFLAAPAPSQGTATYSNGTVTANLGTLAPGQTVTGTIVVTPLSPVVIVNNASVAGDNVDLVPSNNAVATSTTVSPADLNVVVGASPDPVQVGHNLTYTVVVTNNGPADATNVSLVDTLPQNATFISASSPFGVAGANAGTVALNLGTITPGSSVPVTIVVQPTAPVIVTDSASVSSDEIDTNPADNTSTVSVDVSPVDLSVGMVASSGTVVALNPITFTVAVTNNGPNAATNVNFGDALPSGFSVVSATASQGSVFVGTGVVGAALGSLAPGASAIVTIVAQASVTGNYLNSVSATSDQVDTNPTNNTTGVAVAVTNGPGTFQFSSPSYAAKENGGSVSLTVTRASGNLGAINVGYATANGTAIAGANYKSTSGILLFADGQTSATITVPIIDAGIINGDTQFSVNLTSASSGGTIGSVASAAVTIQQTDFNVIGPSVTNVQAQGTAKLVTGVVVSFNQALNPATATLASNYTLLAPTGKKGNGPLAPVAILTPTYNSATHTVTITAAQSLPINEFFQLVINGSGTTGVADLNANQLQGTGTNGTNFTGTFAQGTKVQYQDANLNFVTLQITNGGYLNLYRNISGQGVTLTVTGAAKGRSVLSGSVRKLSQKATGQTSFSEIVGGGFGTVKSLLRTPPFFVDSVTSAVTGSTSTGTSSGGTTTTPILDNAVLHAASASEAKPRVSAGLFARKLHR